MECPFDIELWWCSRYFFICTIHLWGDTLHTYPNHQPGRRQCWVVLLTERSIQRPVSKTAAAEQQHIKESPLRLKRSRCIKGITKEAMIDSDKLRIILPSMLTSSFSVTMRRAWKGTFHEHLFVVLRWPNKSCWERLPLSLNNVSLFRHKWLYFSFGLHTWKSGRHASSLADPNDIYECL